MQNPAQEQLNPLSSQSSAISAAGDAGAVGRYWIYIVEASGGTRRCPFDAPSLIVGRAQDATLRLDHETVSRHHAQIYRDPFNRVWVRDMGSRNGVKLNDKKISEELIVAGDVLKVGRFTLQLRRDAEIKSTESSGTVCEVLPPSAELELATFDGGPAPRIAAEQLSTIMDLGARLWQSPEPTERARLVCELLVDPRLHGEVAWVLRVPRSSQRRPQLLSGPHVRAGLNTSALHVSRTLLRKVLETGQPQLATNVGDTAGRDVALSLSPDVRAIAAAACPLTATEAAVDVLYVIYSPDRALPEWLALTTLVANQFVQSESIWSARRDIEAHAAIDHDLKQASAIQRKLVPRKISIEGLDVALSFEPCRWVGGDYVDVVPTHDGRVLLAVADACGKGLQAALVASWIHTMVRSGVRARMSLHDLMQSMNEHLEEYLPTGSFVTLFAAILDTRNGEFEFANAGHPPAMLLSAGGDVTHLQAESMPLGISHEPAMVSRGTLGNGKMLLLYTDGWTDMPDSSGKPMGLQEFQRQVTAELMGTSMKSAAEFIRQSALSLARHAPENIAADDRTFLAVRRA